MAADGVYDVAVQYGTTPLIWACRKGHAEIVDMLLRAGSQADKAGMVSVLSVFLCLFFSQFVSLMCIRFATQFVLCVIPSNARTLLVPHPEGIRPVKSWRLICRWWHSGTGFSVIFVTKIETRTRIIGRRFQRTRTRIIVIQKTKTK